MKRVEIAPEHFEPRKNFKLSKNVKRGIATTLLAFSMVSIAGCGKDDRNDLYIDNSRYEEANKVIPSEQLAIDIEDINQLNIVINDNDCGDAFFQEVCENLETYGLEFTRSKNEETAKAENATVITLDQVYSTGPSVVLVGSRDDNAATKSEALLMACQSEMYRQGFDSVMVSGLKEFQQQEDGNVLCKKIASPTEEVVADSSSFVTISFGTSNQSKSLVAKTIINALGRYDYFVSNNQDMITPIERETTEPDYVTTDNSYCVNEQMMHLQEFDFQTEVAVDNTKQHSK